MGTLAIFLILLGPAYAATGFDCNSIQNISTVSFADLLLDENLLLTTKIFAVFHPDDFAYVFMKAPGYMAVVEGEKFQIVQCKPVIVQVQPQNKCYNQLPIVQGDQKMFLNPWTLIINTKANEIPCNDPILELYQLDGIQYKVPPKPMSPLKSTEIKTKTPLTWNSGIYCQRFPKKCSPQPEVELTDADVNRNKPGFTYINEIPVPWYKNLEKNDDIVISVVTVIIIILLACIIKMVFDHIKHGSAFHVIKQCRRRRQKNDNQGA